LQGASVSIEGAFPNNFEEPIQGKKPIKTGFAVHKL